MSIGFPHFNIEFNNIQKSISILGFEISIYGILMMIAIISAYFITIHRANKDEQEKEIYLDIAIVCLIASFIGARIVYVIFSWEEYKDDLSHIYSLKTGGMSLYGGLIAGIAACFIYARLKKKSASLILDTCVVGLVFGQAIARWGNFFNRESFGKYTECIFAMKIRRIDAPQIDILKDSRYIENIIKKDGVEYILVHPTFLYEFFACILIFVLLIFLEKYKKFHGEVTLWYLAMYGLARLFIEELRIDKLLIKGTNISISSVLSLIAIVTSVTIIIYKRIVRPKILDKDKIIKKSA